MKSVNLIVALTNSEMVHYHQTYHKNNSASFIVYLKFLKKKVKNHEKLMEEWTNKKITLIMDNASASIRRNRSRITSGEVVLMSCFSLLIILIIIMLNSALWCWRGCSIEKTIMEGKKNKNFQILGFLSETSSTMNFRS